MFEYLCWSIWYFIDLYWLFDSMSFHRNHFIASHFIADISSQTFSSQRHFIASLFIACKLAGKEPLGSPLHPPGGLLGPPDPLGGPLGPPDPLYITLINKKVAMKWLAMKWLRWNVPLPGCSDICLNCFKSKVYFDKFFDYL